MAQNTPRSFRYAGRGNGGAFNWILQRLSGVALIVLAVGHYFLVHRAPEQGHTWAATAVRLQSPWFVGLYSAFLILGMYHAIQGMWNIIRDFRLKPVVGMTIYGLLVVAALVFVGMGLNTLFSFDPTMAQQAAATVAH